MSTIAAYGRKAAADRPGSRRLPRIPALASALALAALAPGFAPEAAAQSRSGITINNDVLNSLGPGPAAAPAAPLAPSWQPGERSEEHTSELQSLMRISYAVFCLKKKKQK